MKVLILGSKGMLGKVLQNEFRTDNIVVAWDSNHLDITNKQEVKNRLEDEQPNVVINAAAYNAVDKIEENSIDYKIAEVVNGYAVGYLAEATKNLNIPLIHFSSDYVFKGDNKFGYNETANIDAVNKYGETKAFGEKLLKSATDKYYLVRLSRLFGPTGESEMAKKSFVDIMLDLVASGRNEIDLVDDEKTCPTYSKDLVKLICYIIENQLPFGIYHGANTGACTWYEFAKEIFKIKNLNVKCNPVPASKFPRPAKRPNYSELLNTKLPKQRSWQEALEEYLVSQN